MVKEIDGGHASTGAAGQRLYQLIKPALARGEEVILDFEGVKHCGVHFFGASVGVLIEIDKVDRVPELLRCENAKPDWQEDLERATDFAVRRRDNPAGAAAWDAAYKKLLGGEDWA